MQDSEFMSVQTSSVPPNPVDVSKIPTKNPSSLVSTDQPPQSAKSIPSSSQDALSPEASPLTTGSSQTSEQPIHPPSPILSAAHPIIKKTPATLVTIESSSSLANENLLLSERETESYVGTTDLTGEDIKYVDPIPQTVEKSSQTDVSHVEVDNRATQTDSKPTSNSIAQTDPIPAPVFVKAISSSIQEVKPSQEVKANVEPKESQIRKTPSRANNSRPASASSPVKVHQTSEVAEVKKNRPTSALTITGQ